MNADVDTLMLRLQTNLGWGSIALMVVMSLPPLFVLYSKRVSGSQKVLWFLLTSILSWLAYLPFLFIFRNEGTDGQKASK